MIKQKTKKNSYSIKLIKFQSGVKKLWNIMKDPIGKRRVDKLFFPQKVVIN